MDANGTSEQLGKGGCGITSSGQQRQQQSTTSVSPTRSVELIDSHHQVAELNDQDQPDESQDDNNSGQRALSDAANSTSRHDSDIESRDVEHLRGQQSHSKHGSDTARAIVGGQQDQEDLSPNLGRTTRCLEILPAACYT